jgi:L-lactate dehydrogenase complex protein LldG
MRRSLGVSGNEPARKTAVAARLAASKPNTIPARGQLDREGRIALFRAMAERVSASVERVGSAAEVPGALAAFLRGRNLPMQVRMGSDPAIASLPWDRAPHLDRLHGASDGRDLVCLSHAVGGVAESGTLMLASGPDNPTTLNFLPETHVVMVSADDIAGDYETLWARMRERCGPGVLPRTVNLITGPSRSADIEQTLLLGAHGPRALHIIIVG